MHVLKTRADVLLNLEAHITGLMLWTAGYVVLQCSLWPGKGLRRLCTTSTSCSPRLSISVMGQIHDILNHRRPCVSSTKPCLSCQYSLRAGAHPQAVGSPFVRRQI